MKNHKCIYVKSLYYACVYLALVLIGFGLSVLNTMFNLNSEILNVIGFGSLIVPTVPLQWLLFSQGMMVTNGEWVMPTDTGIIVSHAVWFAFFYAVYFIYLKWGKCLCKCMCKCPFKK